MPQSIRVERRTSPLCCLLRTSNHCRLSTTDSTSHAAAVIEGVEGANPKLWKVIPGKVPTICTGRLQTQARRFSMQGTDEIGSVTAPFCSARTSFCFTLSNSPTSAYDGAVVLLLTRHCQFQHRNWQAKQKRLTRFGKRSSVRDRV